MKRYVISILLCISILIPCLPRAYAEGLPEVTAEGFMLIDIDSGKVLGSKNSDQRLYPASLTKLMTALLTVTLAKDLDAEQVTVSDHAITSLAGTGSSVGGLRPSEIYTLRQLLYLLLLPSGNDAANVLAEYFCGSNEKFAELMNTKAAELGMVNSHFVNPHGLHDPAHYSTPKDLSLLSLAVLQYPVLKEIVSTVEYTVPNTGLQDERTVYTTNAMKMPDNEYYYPGVYGVKTGYTNYAGHCLIAAAERDGMNFLCVLMNCPVKGNSKTSPRYDFLDAAALFDYSFSNYVHQKLYAKNQIIATKKVDGTFTKSLNIVAANDLYYTLPKATDLSLLQWNIEYNALGNAVKAPLQKGCVLGSAEVSLDGEVIGRVDLVADRAVRPNPLIIAWRKVDTATYVLIAIAGLLLLLFVILVLRARIIRRKRRRRRARNLKRY